MGQATAVEDSEDTVSGSASEEDEEALAAEGETEEEGGGVWPRRVAQRRSQGGAGASPSSALMVLQDAYALAGVQLQVCVCVWGGGVCALAGVQLQVGGGWGRGGGAAGPDAPLSTALSAALHHQCQHCQQLQRWLRQIISCSRNNNCHYKKQR